MTVAGCGWCWESLHSKELKPIIMCAFRTVRGSPCRVRPSVFLPLVPCMAALSYH
ncbi:hypothetical protein BDR06DRAFT_955543 [Suillus hirtellus]|nr:hypothetical protein BDR06DRAFT_955543 [Suillus hirtellus]